MTIHKLNYGTIWHLDSLSKGSWQYVEDNFFRPFVNNLHKNVSKNVCLQNILTIQIWFRINLQSTNKTRQIYNIVRIVIIQLKNLQFFTLLVYNLQGVSEWLIKSICLVLGLNGITWAKVGGKISLRSGHFDIWLWK